jgi:hypothetical protein
MAAAGSIIASALINWILLCFVLILPSLMTGYILYRVKIMIKNKIQDLFFRLLGIFLFIFCIPIAFIIFLVIIFLVLVLFSIPGVALSSFAFSSANLTDFLTFLTGSLYFYSSIIISILIGFFATRDLLGPQYLYRLFQCYFFGNSRKKT